MTRHHTHTPTLLVLVVSGLVLVACGEDGDGEAGAATTGGSGAASSTSADGGGSTSSGDGGSTGSGDGGGGGAPVDPSTLPDWGLVGLYQFGEGGSSYEIFAAFQRGRPEADTYDGGCDVVERDGCIARRCEGTREPNPLGGMDAGELTLSGPLAELDVPRGDDGNYWRQGPGPSFEDVTPLDVTFSGADVPAFEATLEAPPRILALAPSPLVVIRDDDLHFTWDAEGEGFVQFWYLVQDEGVVEDVSCIFHVDDAAGTIPGDLMPTGDAGSVIFSVANRREIAVGTHAVTVQSYGVEVFANYQIAVDE